jgi:hypothetical protein
VLPKSIRFYEDRIEVTGTTNGIFRYEEVLKVTPPRGFGGPGSILVRGTESPIPLIGKPKTGSNAQFYAWLIQRLDGTSAEFRWTERPWRTNPLGLAIIVALCSYLGVVFGGLITLGTMAGVGFAILSGLSILPAAAGFVVVFHHSVQSSRTPDGTGSVARESCRSPWQEVVQSFLSRRARLAPSILLLLVLGTFVISAPLLLPGENSYFLNSWNTTWSRLNAASPLVRFVAIFSNNLKVAVLGLVPGMGPLFEAAATYNTARVIEAVALNTGSLPAIYAV